MRRLLGGRPKRLDTVFASALRHTGEEVEVSTATGIVRALLAENTPGFPEPFVPGGAERVWAAAATNPSLFPALIRALPSRDAGRRARGN